MSLIRDVTLYRDEKRKLLNEAAKPYEVAMERISNRQAALEERGLQVRQQSAEMVAGFAARDCE